MEEIFAGMTATVIENGGRAVREFVKYSHHDTLVWVEARLKGTHRECCLCFKCAKFVPVDSGAPESAAKNCPIANEVFEVCGKYGLVTPVFECPEFVPTLVCGRGADEPLGFGYVQIPANGGGADAIDAEIRIRAQEGGAE